MTSSLSSHCHIVCDTELPALLREWRTGRITYNISLLESPLFSPGPELVVLQHSSRCSAATHRLLVDMLCLTRAFEADLDHFAASRFVLPGREGSLLFRSEVVSSIQQRVFALPSATIPGLPETGDWVYEACRIAALIYTIAIIGMVPFSTAVFPAGQFIQTRSGTQLRLVEDLYAALQQCNMDDAWGDMGGVLYWVTSVGAAAARVDPSHGLSVAHHPDVPHQVRVFRTLNLYSVQALVVLVFQFPGATILGQKTMLRIQSALRSFTKHVH
jgi:hypothetical protein